MGVLFYFCGAAFGHVNTLTDPVHRIHAFVVHQEERLKQIISRPPKGRNFNYCSTFSIELKNLFTSL